MALNQTLGGEQTQHADGVEAGPDVVADVAVKGLVGIRLLRMKIGIKLKLGRANGEIGQRPTSIRQVLYPQPFPITGEARMQTRL